MFLCLDEMAISAGHSYDPSTDKVVGNVSLPNHSGDSTHALAIVLGGIRHHWKQTVAYYFSPNSVDGSEIGTIIIKIIKKVKNINLDVIAIVSDMGSSNRKIWQ